MPARLVSRGAPRVGSQRREDATADGEEKPAADPDPAEDSAPGLEEAPETAVPGDEEGQLALFEDALKE